MTRCANEREWPSEGVNWAPPADLNEVRIETSRLVVRLYTLDDAESVFATVTSNRAYLARWMDWVEHYKSVEAAQEYIVRHRLGIRRLAESRELGLGIFDRSSGQFLGGSGFHGLRLDSASAETGYWVREDRAGRGFASEAAAAMVSFMLRPQARGGLGLQRVRSFCSGDNPGSRRVLEKIGLPLEGVQRGDYFVKGHGRITDRVCFGVMHDEWDCENSVPVEGTPRTRLTPSSA